MSPLRKEVFYMITALTCFSFILIYKEYNIISDFVSIRERKPRNRTILYWNPSNKQAFRENFDPYPFANCFYKNCFLTLNKTEIPVEDFDAILFEPKLEEKFTKPKTRKATQVYVFATRQSPSYTSLLTKEHNNFFNWTMTYREDSDILWKHGYIVKVRSAYIPPSAETVKKKKKKVAWIASRCQVESHREKVVNLLATRFPVEIFGECGHRLCPKNQTKECFKMFQRQFKFYLSFEDSICQDYVSGELFEALKYNLVPIVYGGANYSSLLNSTFVINVMNFKDVEHLVKYLSYLDKDIAEYLEFFEWKKRHVVLTNTHRPFCELCRKLNVHIKPKTYINMAKWWAGPYFDKCDNTCSFCNKV